MRKGKLLSIVIPAYNEQGNILPMADEMEGLLRLQGIDFELIFVDDGSSDNTWASICEVAKNQPHIGALRLSRNFGKEGAIFAGLQAAQGQACIVMDCDLQHPPSTALEMYRLWENNDVDVVEAHKSSRGKEGLLYKLFAKSFYKLLKSTAKIDLAGASDFKLLDRKAVDALLTMPERQTFFRAMSSWVGFRVATIDFDVAPRNEGKTKWSPRALFKLAINSITSFTNLPTQIVTICGIFFFVFAAILGVNTMADYFSGRAQEGFSTVILLLLIIGAIIMFSLGIIGHYLSKIYEEIKFRPRYLVSEVIKASKSGASGKDDHFGYSQNPME